MTHIPQMARIIIALIIIVPAAAVSCTKRKVHDFFPVPLTSHAEKEFFGCKINGLPFVPKAPSEAGLGSCLYDEIYSGPSGYRLSLISNSQGRDCDLLSVAITLDSIELKEGRTYLLGSEGQKKNYAAYTIVSDCVGGKQQMFTTDDRPGEITITELDLGLRYVAGHFNFSVKDSSGNNYRISEGLFDQLFTN